MIKIWHKTFNPQMETIQSICGEVDKLEQGWKLSKVVAITICEWVAIFDCEVKDE